MYAFGNAQFGQVTGLQEGVPKRRTTGKLCWSWPRMRRGQMSLAAGIRGDPQNAAIRRHAIAVMDAVDRNGLVAPWTAVPYLLALTTDPNR